MTKMMKIIGVKYIFINNFHKSGFYNIAFFSNEKNKFIVTYPWHDKYEFCFKKDVNFFFCKIQILFFKITKLCI